MRLSSFSVINYRSITNARKIQTNNMTVLVGKNNEGKSNILRALTLAMDIMKMYASDPRSLRLSANYLRSRTRYIWERDYPLSLQERNPNGFSSIDLDFELTSTEISAVRDLTGIRLSGHIPVRVSINHSTVKIDIPKRGTPAFANVENKLKIIEYAIFNKLHSFNPFKVVVSGCRGCNYLTQTLPKTSREHLDWIEIFCIYNMLFCCVLSIVF